MGECADEFTPRIGACLDDDDDDDARRARVLVVASVGIDDYDDDAVERAREWTNALANGGGVLGRDAGDARAHRG